MITCSLIAETVAGRYEVSVRELFSRRHGREILLPRRLSWILARRLTSRSFPDIGRLMGGFDHTTVMHGIRQIHKEISEVDETAKEYADLVTVVTELESKAPTSGIGKRFGDLDPIEVARAVLGAAFRDVVPTLEEIRALCLGITHYADEVSRVAQLLAAETANRATDRLALQTRDEEIARLKAVTDPALKNAAAITFGAWADLQNKTFTSEEQPARRAFEARLNALKTHFERT